MARLKTFTFRVNDEEEELINAVARKMQRNSSDAMRIIVHQVAAGMGIAPSRDGAAIVEVKRLQIKAERVGELEY